MLQESPESSQSGRIAFFKIFLWGALVTSVLVGLIFLYVPAAPKGQQKTVSVSQYESAPAESAQPTSDSGSGQGSTASGGESGTPAAQTSRSAESVYHTYCAQCHGKSGDGDAPMARMMSSKPTHLITGPFRFGRDPQSIAQLIRSGSGAMPGFKDEINEQEALSVAEFVLGLAEQK
jgi:mono/diheme cytochrome c family protein